MEWISVKDRLPEGVPKLKVVLLEGNIIKLASYIPKQYWDGCDCCITNCPRWDVPIEWKAVTHWLDVPDFPSDYSYKQHRL